MFKAALIPFIALALVFGGHYIVFRLFYLFFQIERAVVSITVGIVLTLGALSFPPAALLVRHSRTLFNQWLFIGAVLWFGFFVNLLLISIGGGILYLAVSRFYSLSKYTYALGVIWVLSAILLTAFGVYSAEVPEVRHISLTLKDLPSQWEGKRLVHLTDIHLGIVHGKGFMERLAKRVNELEPHVIAITGDIFDGLGGDIEALIDSVNLLKAKEGVLIISGNHEGYNARRVDIDSLMRKLSGTLLDNKIVDIDGINFIGVKYPGYSGEDEFSKDKLGAIREATGRKGPSILLFHTPTDIIANFKNHAHQQMTTYWQPDTSCTFNKDLGLDLQLSGHTHGGQFQPFVWLTKYIYSGRHYGLFRDGAFQLYVSSGTGTFGPPMRTGCPSEIVVFSLKGEY